MIFFHTQAIHHPASSSETTTESVYDDEGRYDISQEWSEVSRHLSFMSRAQSHLRIADLDLFFCSVCETEEGWFWVSTPTRTGPKISPF